MLALSFASLVVRSRARVFVVHPVAAKQDLLGKVTTAPTVRASVERVTASGGARGPQASGSRLRASCETRETPDAQFVTLAAFFIV